jgi:hypothetical protein
MGSIGGGDDVRGVDVGAEFLFDPLKQPLGACALDLDLDSRILGLEGLAELFPDRQIHRRIKHDPAVFPRRLDQLRCDCRRIRRSRLQRRCKQRKAKRSRSADDFAPGRLSARQRSAGSVSQTSVPRGTLICVDVTARNVVPSDVSTT